MFIKNELTQAQLNIGSNPGNRTKREKNIVAIDAGVAPMEYIRTDEDTTVLPIFMRMHLLLRYLMRLEDINAFMIKFKS